jgi:hypothetical protein
MDDLIIRLEQHFSEMEEFLKVAKLGTNIGLETKFRLVIKEKELAEMKLGLEIIKDGLRKEGRL